MQEGQRLFAERMRAFTPAEWEQIPDLGLYMDQVVTYIERQLRPLLGENERVFTPSMVNNYVKMGLVSRPVDKKYGRDQLAQLLMIALLKQGAMAEEMKRLLQGTEHATVQEVYEAFCITHRETFEELAASLPLPASMHCALRASTYRLLLSAAMGREEPDGQALKNGTGEKPAPAKKEMGVKKP